MTGSGIQFGIASLPAAAALCLGCSSPAQTSWCESAAYGAEVIVSKGPGIWQRQGLSPHLQELWRAGGLREAEELAFPVGAVASPSGRLAIADFRLGEVVVLEPDGSWLGPWGTRGDGPGELSFPVAANWDRRDEALAVFDIGKSKVVFLLDGQPVREDVRVSATPVASIVNSGELQWAGVQPSGGVIVQPVPSAVPGDVTRRRAAILYIAPGATVEDTLAWNWSPTIGGPSDWASLAAPGWPHLMATIGTDGKIVIGGMDSRYRLLLLDEHAKPTGVICRDSPPLELGDRELRAPPDVPLRSADLRQAPRPDSLAPYGRVFLGAHGRLWVQRERPSSARYRENLLGVPGSMYDVFEDDGQYLGPVQAPAQVRLQAAAGDTVWGYQIGELDETWVVAYGLHLESE